MNAILDQMIESNHHSFTTDQKNSRDFGSPASASSQGRGQRPTAKSFSWSNLDFDRPCAEISPLND